jgi:hypothetical protein
MAREPRTLLCVNRKQSKKGGRRRRKLIDKDRERKKTDEHL